jgi:hypothetical protein
VPITGPRVIRRALRLLAAGLLTCAALAPAAPAALHEGEQGAVRLRVMTLNVFYGADELDSSRAKSQRFRIVKRRA